MNKNPEIAIIDDHPILRSGLAGVLSGRGFDVVLQSGQSDTLLEWLDDGESLDLVLLDMDLGAETGLDVLRTLRGKEPELLVVMLSHMSDPEVVRRTLDDGANGFISKQESGETLAVLLRSILQGVSPVISPVIQVAMRKQSEQATPLDDLSFRELEVLRLLVSGYRYREIAEDLGVSKRTIEYHAQMVRHKLEAESLVVFVRIADEHLPRMTDAGKSTDENDRQFRRK